MKKMSLFFIFLGVISACGPKSSNNKTSFILSDIFSNRQQTTTIYVGVIQLQLPALLASAVIIDGKSVITEEAKKAIVAEQEEVIQSLKDLSSEIKIISTYKLVLNGIAFVAPTNMADKIAKIQGVNKVIENSNFGRPQNSSTEDKLLAIDGVIAAQGLNDHNSVTFIGADLLHKAGITGLGMRVGIIDTGLDYTHSMLGGLGKKEIYDSIDPSKESEYFPNKKVVGGVDFVGLDFSSGDPDVEKNIPKRDVNPIDEAGHGSHVAGTVAGLGDGLKTYSGVAPEASLYALKVFGKEGSTSDVSVIAALEYAADPSEKMDPTNRLDVVNLSLGGGYGKPKIFYTEAIKNLTRGGTVVVASAGNAGDNPYIVGSPSTSEEAISVAASFDDMAQNIIFPAVGLKIGNSDEQLLEIVEGVIGVPSIESHVSGTIIYIGNGADPISDEVKLNVKGKIALIDRGVISFVDKLKVAVDLGAIGVVVANNQDSESIQMGGEGKFEIPAVMISRLVGVLIKEALKNNTAAEFNFSTGKVITHSELIDTITAFSSRGPRSIDSLIKPEISAPGSKIISAAMGAGDQGVQLSGTSMSGPHIAGVMTLLKQAFPKLSVAELKAKVLNNSKIMMKDAVHVPVSLQGAGRVQVEQAYKSQVIVMPATLSLGEISISSKKTVSKAITLKNLSDKDIVFSSRALNSKNIKVSLTGSFKVKANSTLTLNISFTLQRANAEQNNIEADGFVILKSGDGLENINLPFLAVLNKVTNIIGSDFLTLTNSEDDKLGSEVRLTLTNKGQSDGDALIFNLLGSDDRKVLLPPLNLSKGNGCDLETAGIRLVNQENAGVKTVVLQIGVKLYDTLTMWQPCDVSLQIDSDSDGIADQELVGTKASNLAGIKIANLASLLLDAKMVRDLRKEYEASPSINEENYVTALMDVRAMKFYDHSNVAVIETDITKIATKKNGMIAIKLAVSSLESDESTDDFLGDHETKWQKINISENSFSFYDMPETVTVKANDLEHISMKRGAGRTKLLVLYPNNAPAINDVSKDRKSQVLVEKTEK